MRKTLKVLPPTFLHRLDISLPPLVSPHLQVIRIQPLTSSLQNQAFRNKPSKSSKIVFRAELSESSRQNQAFRVKPSESSLHNPSLQNQNFQNQTFFRIKPSESSLRNRAFRIKHSESSLENRAFRIKPSETSLHNRAFRIEPSESSFRTTAYIPAPLRDLPPYSLFSMLRVAGKTDPTWYRIVPLI